MVSKGIFRYAMEFRCILLVLLSIVAATPVNSQTTEYQTTRLDATELMTGESTTIADTTKATSAKTTTVVYTTEVTNTGEPTTVVDTTEATTGEATTIVDTTEATAGQATTIIDTTEATTVLGESTITVDTTDAVTGEATTIVDTIEAITGEATTIVDTTEATTGEITTVVHTTEAITGEATTVVDTTKATTGSTMDIKSTTVMTVTTDGEPTNVSTDSTMHIESTTVMTANATDGEPTNVSADSTMHIDSTTVMTANATDGEPTNISTDGTKDNETMTVSTDSIMRTELTTVSTGQCPPCAQHSNCTDGNIGCVCDFGYVSMVGGNGPPCRELFCNETCVATGQFCDENDTCSCSTTDNFESSNDICTKVCPMCSENSACYDPYDGCRCLPGYTGDGIDCYDIDECADVSNYPGDCPIGEIYCDNKNGSYRCGCNPDFYYDAKTDGCIKSNCDNTECGPNSVCGTSGGVPECVCNRGYEGYLTEKGCKDINECLTVCLEPTEKCFNDQGSFRCECIEGYQRDSNNCQPVKCRETTVSCQKLANLCVNATEKVIFPATPAGYMTSSHNKCGQDTESAGRPFATRSCLLTGRWGDPTWLSNCGTSLEKLAGKLIEDEESRQSVSNDLQVLTSEPDTLKPDDIRSTAVAIEAIANATELSDTVVTSVVSTISNLMGAPKIDESGDTAGLIAKLDEVAGKVNLTSYNSPTSPKARASDVTSNFNVTIGDIFLLARGGSEGFGVAVLRRPKTEDGFRSDQITVISERVKSGDILEDGNRVEASIYIPKSAVNQGRRSWIIGYGSTILFPRSKNDNKVSQTMRVPQDSIVSYDMVLSANVLDKNITNLPANDDISFSFPVIYDDAVESPLCAFWLEDANDWSAEGCTASSNSTNTSVDCACTHLTNFATLLAPDAIVSTQHALDIITIVGCSISSVALVAAVLIHAFYAPRKSPCGKRHHASFLLVALSLTLLGLNITLLISELPWYSDSGYGASGNSPSCIAIAMLLHFFMLSSTAWMNSEAVVFAIAVMKPLYSRNTLESKWVVLWSILWAILLPLLFVAMVATVNLDFYVYPERERSVTCWIEPDSVVNFALIPTALMIGFNFVLYLIMLYYLFILRVEKMGKYWAVKRRSQKRRLGANITIATNLGLTWTFGFFMASFSDEAGILVFAYIFTITTSLQGFFLLLLTTLRNHELRRSIANQWTSILGISTTRASQDYVDSIRNVKDNSWDSQYSDTSFTYPGNPYTRPIEDKNHLRVLSEKSSTYRRHPTNPGGGLVIENWRRRPYSN